MIITRNHLHVEWKERLLQVRQRIGSTTLYTFRHLYPRPGVCIQAKLEWEQLGGSIKARPALRIMETAIESGKLNPNKILIDASNGNMGMAYAAIGKELGLAVALCLPEDTSCERKEILRSLGAQLIYTPAADGINGAIRKAREIARLHPTLYYYADQYQNDANWLAHYFGTAEELFRQSPEMTHFVAGLGSAGTFAGISRRIKDSKPCIQTISLQPNATLHSIEGWIKPGSSGIPGLYDPSIADEMLTVTNEEVSNMAQRIYHTEGLQLSPSAAANIAGAVKVADRLKQGTVVTVLADQVDPSESLYQNRAAG
ncbi:MAG TPA: cysteine synthase family protein [Ferruginibacter sp.]|nr:cysteine synthase family protein [Ferruginibacter sp.]